jgi:hypothetical protein
MNTEIFNKIINIEKLYPVETIEYKKIKIWPFVRTIIFFNSLYNDIPVNKNKKISFLNKIYLIIRSIKYTHFKLLFKKNGTILFTHVTNTDVRLLNGIKIDAFFNEIIEQESNIIPIILNKNFKYIPFLKFIDRAFLIFIITLWSKINIIDKNKILNKKLLYDIFNYFNINVDIIKIISKIHSSIFIYDKYFNIIKPNKIYVICYYDIYIMTASYAAKKRNIPVIEIQHGIIHKNHLSYISEKNIQDNPYPNYFFCFGNEYKNIISENIYKKENIFITGYYYLNLIIKRKKNNYKQFSEKYNKYQNKIIITVGSIDNYDKEILNEIIRISSI